MSRNPYPADWMWSQAVDFIEQAERMHRQFFRLASSQRSQALWEPPADVFEDEHEMVIVVALPGVAPVRAPRGASAGALRDRVPGAHARLPGPAPRQDRLRKTRQ